MKSCMLPQNRIAPEVYKRRATCEMENKKFTTTWNSYCINISIPIGAYTQAVRKESSTRAKFNEKVVAAMRMKAGQVLARAVDKQLAGLHV